VSKQIRLLGGALTVLLLAMLANLTYIQVFQADELRAKPGNQRAVLEEYSIERGPIVVGSAAVAQSVKTTSGELQYQREYTAGPRYVPATGFYSRLYGSTGLEKAAQDILSGNDDRFFVSRLQQLIAGRDQQGGTVTTTLIAAAQEAAERGLQGKIGAVAAIDPRTGAILALVQSPSLDADPTEPLLNRPLVKLLAPGSTFKVVVAAAALESGRFTPSSVLPGPAFYTLPGTSTQMGNWFDGPCGPNDQVTLEEALVISCNTAFGWLGNELGEDALREQAQKFGFDTSFDVPMTAAAARFPTDPDDPQVALSAIGQYEVRATALAMAQVAGAVANDGVTMYPTLVESVSAPDLTVLETLQPRSYAQALSATRAQQLTDMMVAVVSRGTGSNARIPGVAVGGKTGTAETGNEQPNIAWFIALAPANNAEVAVAVMVENAGTPEVSGNQLAAPIARAVIEAVLAE
jgi:peptidoglycan glycosyltransferase